MKMSRPTRRDEFGVAIVCALPLEFDAVALALDEIWPENLGKAAGDYNTYTLGRIGNQNVVLVLLPNMGKTSAAGAATSLRHSFTALKLAFLCGICGGVPNPEPGVEIVLGDVIISESVVQYDYGRRYPSRFAHKDTCNDAPGRPIREIRSLLTLIKTDLGRSQLQREIPDITEKIQLKSAGHGQKYRCPGFAKDVLFRASYLHRHRESECGCGEDDICDVAVDASCAELQCESEAHVPRRRLQVGSSTYQGATPHTARLQPQVFIGNVASGDTVMKSGEHRDDLAKEHDIIAFEMEGAGVWDEVPCIIVKSVCDYADSHKNKEWQGFAAVTAASATKILIGKYVSAVPPAAEHADNHSRSVIKTTEESGPAFLVPYPKNPDFVDRSDVFDRLRELYGHADNNNKRTRTRLALHGLGGVGKTQIALAYCYWFQEKFPDAHVFWIHASNIDRFRQAFTEIARECDISEHETTGDILTLVKKWLENRKAGRWLLVIDNADDLEVFFPPSPSSKDNKLGSQNPEAQTHVGRFIPNCNHGTILITTRNKQAGLRLAPGKDSIIQVSRMTETETELLLRSLILENEDISSQETSLLSNRLEHLPLAIAQAASFINENFISINEYIELLDQSDLSLVERLSEPFEAVGRDSETPHALTATWMISFDQIKQQFPLASDALAFISLLDRQAIPKQLVRDYCTLKLAKVPSSKDDPGTGNNVDLQVTKALGTLLAFSFISKAGDDLFDMHRLVQLTTHKRLVDEKSMGSYANSAVAAMSRSYPDGRWENWKKCQEYLPHALAVLKRTQLDEREARIQAAYINCEVAKHLYHRGFYEDAKRYQKKALETRAELLGQEDSNALHSMRYLAEAYRKQGQFDEALKMLSRLLEIRQRLQGKEHADTLTANFLLAKTYKDQGDYRKAEKLHMQRLEVEKRILGREDPSTLATMHDLALLYLETNRLRESEELSLRLIAAEAVSPINRFATMDILSRVYFEQDRLEEAQDLITQLVEQETQLLGEDDPQTLTSLRTLADVRGAQGHRIEKAEISRRVLETKRRIWGNADASTLTSICDLAVALEGTDNLGEAAELRQEHLDTTLLVHGHRHSSTSSSKYRLAQTWSYMTRWEDAASMFEECLESEKQILGRGHKDTLTTMHVLAHTWRKVGRVEDAVKLFEECLEGRKQIGYRHKNTLSTMHELAYLWSIVGRMEDAAKLFEECLEGEKQILGHRHKNTLSTMHELAYLWSIVGRMEDAAKLFEECLEGEKQILGHRHKNTLSTMHELAHSWRKLGRVEDARKLYEECLEGRKQVYGPEAERTLDSMFELAFALRKLGRLEEATKIYEECLERRRQTPGSTHKNTLMTMDNLADCLDSLGRVEDATKLMRECVDGRKQILGEDHTHTKDAIKALSKYEERLQDSRCEGEDDSVSDNVSKNESDDNSGNESDTPVVQGWDEDSDSDPDEGSGVLLMESP